MRMDLSFLSDWLSYSFPVESVHNKGRHKLLGVRMYRPGCLLREDRCYICKPDKYDGSIAEEGSYILIGRDDERFHSADRIIIGQDISSSIIQEYLQDTFDEIAQWEQSVTEAVAEDMGIQRILELSSSIFGYNTMIVTSISRMVLGYVQNSGPGLTLASRSTIGGQEYVQPPSFLRRTAEMLADDDRKEAFFSTEPIGDSCLRVLRCNLFSGRDHLTARLTIAQYDKELKGCHTELAAYLASQISLAMERTTELIHWKSGSGLIGLSDALKEGIPDLHAANQLCALAGWEAGTHYMILIVDFGNASYSAEEYVHSLRFIFTSQYPLLQTLILDQRMVVICNTKQAPVITQDFADWLCGYVKEFHFSCGISEEFDDISHANLFYTHALFALRQAGEGSLCTYADCLTADVISCYKKEHYSRCGIIHPVEALASHDQVHHSSLVRTLYCYLLLDRSHRRCAEALDIHKSSLQYRLSLIRDITGLTFETLTPEQRMNLLLSLRLAM